MTHKLMHENVGKHVKDAKKQRKPNRRHKTSKASMSTSHEVEKGHASSKPMPQKCIPQVVESKLSIRGTDATTQASGLKDQQTQTHEGHKAWQSLVKPRSRQANMDIKHRSKQANIDMHKGNDPNPLI